MSAQDSTSSATPDQTDSQAAQVESDREVLLMLAVLLGLLVIAAIVFLVIPTEWIGAKVEVIIRQ